MRACVCVVLGSFFCLRRLSPTGCLKKVLDLSKKRLLWFLEFRLIPSPCVGCLCWCCMRNGVLSILLINQLCLVFWLEAFLWIWLVPQTLRRLCIFRLLAATGAPNYEIVRQVGIIKHNLVYVLFGHVALPALQDLVVWIKVDPFVQEMLSICLVLLSHLFVAHCIPVLGSNGHLLGSVGIVVTHVLIVIHRWCLLLLVLVLLLPIVFIELVTIGLRQYSAMMSHCLVFLRLLWMLHVLRLCSYTEIYWLRWS